jgi:phosphatidylcholine synthase
MNGASQPALLPRFLAWSVHLYTALGSVAALAALRAIVDRDARAAFAWMTVALVIDSSDGALARAARVKEVVPTYDGSKLDDIVDYLNYVVVPMFFAVQMGMLPPSCAGAIAAAPLLSSAYGFCQSAAKTADFFFTGFPSYWNVAVFYLYVGGLSPTTNAVVLIVLSVLVFVPIGYLYPTRQPFLRPLTITLAIVWGVALVFVFYRFPEPSLGIVYGSLAFPLYYFALSIYLDVQRRRRAP